MFPGTYDYLGWITSGLAMSNGGEYYNTGYGGEVYYNAPTTIGAVKLIDAMVHKWHVMPEGVTDANAVTTAFFQGRTAMMVLSTGSLSFVRENMKTPYRMAFLPRALVNAAPIGGASLIIPSGNSPERQAAAWTLINWLVSPEIAGGWSRFTGYFAPRIAAYDLPEMKAYLAHTRTPRWRWISWPMRAVVRHLQHGGGAQGAGGRGAGGALRQDDPDRSHGRRAETGRRAAAALRRADRAKTDHVTGCNTTCGHVVQPIVRHDLVPGIDGSQRSACLWLVDDLTKLGHGHKMRPRLHWPCGLASSPASRPTLPGCGPS